MISVPSRRNLRSESVGKCSTCQSFTRTESPSCRIATLPTKPKIEMFAKVHFCFLSKNFHIGDAGDWTRGLSHAKRTRYHCATSPSYYHLLNFLKQLSQSNWDLPAMKRVIWKCECESLLEIFVCRINWWSFFSFPFQQVMYQVSALARFQGGLDAYS